MSSFSEPSVDDYSKRLSHMQYVPVTRKKYEEGLSNEFVPRSTLNGSTGSLDSFNNQSINNSSRINSYAHIASLGNGSMHSSSVGASPLESPRNSPILDYQNNSSLIMPMQENIGGTTFFYTEGNLNSSQNNMDNGYVCPNFTMYPGPLPHVAHMKLKHNIPSFFMPDEIKMEMLNRHVSTWMQYNYPNSDVPHQVENYQNIVPLEMAAGICHKSLTFDYPTTCYKAMSRKDGATYCLRRIHGFKLVNTKLLSVIDSWKKISQPNIVQLREVFTTKAFGDNSMVFVYDYFPGAETLKNHHFGFDRTRMNGLNRSFQMNSSGHVTSIGSAVNGSKLCSGLLPEHLIWTYIVQITSALRIIHGQHLACRVLDPSKILICSKSRIRLNCLGIFDVLTFDASQSNSSPHLSHYQQNDLISLGKILLSLSCNSINAIIQENIPSSLEHVARHYTPDLKSLIFILIANPNNRLKSINDIMPMIGARFYTQLDATNYRNDVLENELSKEVENGRLFRLIVKFSSIMERSELNGDLAWSETGDRYMLKLFRDYLFHQVDPNGSPWTDMGHIVQTLNKFDSGSNEKIMLTSRDDQTLLIASYAEIKRCFETAYSEIVQSSRESNNLDGNLSSHYS